MAEVQQVSSPLQLTKDFVIPLALLAMVVEIYLLRLMGSVKCHARSLPSSTEKSMG